MKKYRILLYFFIILLLFISLLCFFISKEVGSAPSDEELKNYKKLEYFKNSSFSSAKPPKNDFKDIYSFFKHYFSISDKPKNIPFAKLNASDFGLKPENFSFYWLGHSSVLAEFGSARVLFDPVFGSASALPFILKRFSPPGASIKDLPKIDIIIISHNHFDHLEKRSIQTISARHYIVPLGVKNTLIKWGIEEDKITELGWDDESEILGLKIIATKALHNSGRGLFDTNLSLCNSYSILSPNKKLFFSGDSALGEHFSTIGERFGGFDMVFLDLGGDKNGHLDANDALVALKGLKAKAFVPIHWAAFNAKNEDWSQNIEALYQNHGEFNMLTPIIGAKIDENSTKPWWRDVK